MERRLGAADAGRATDCVSDLIGRICFLQASSPRHSARVHPLYRSQSTSAPNLATSLPVRPLCCRLRRATIPLTLQKAQVAP